MVQDGFEAGGGQRILICGEQHDIPLARIAAERLNLGRSFGPCRSFGILRNQELVAVIVFSEFRHPNIEATIWSSTPRWATPPVLRAVMQYAFHQLGCKRITATTEATNQPAREFLCRLGFRQEGVHPDALPTGDAVSYGLLRIDAARWLAEDRSIERRSRRTVGT